MSTLIYKGFRYPRNRNNGTLIAVLVDNVGVTYCHDLKKAIFVAGKLKAKGLHPVIMPNANPKIARG